VKPVRKGQEKGDAGQIPDAGHRAVDKSQNRAQYAGRQVLEGKNNLESPEKHYKVVHGFPPR